MSKMDPKTQFDDLPPYWQKEIKKLRTECAATRVKLRESEATVKVLTGLLAR
jgi:hypothetical protein